MTIDDNDIELPLFVLYGRIKPLEICKVCYVALYRCDVIADLGNRRFELRLPTAGDVDVRAFLDKLRGGAKPIPVAPPVTTATLFLSV